MLNPENEKVLKNIKETIYANNISAHCFMIDENGEYPKILDVNSDLYTMVPFLSFDKFSHTNYGIYQDGVGQMIDIIE